MQCIIRGSLISKHFVLPYQICISPCRKPRIGIIMNTQEIHKLGLRRKHVFEFAFRYESITNTNISVKLKPNILFRE